jgi:hypothetical protein
VSWPRELVKLGELAMGTVGAGHKSWLRWPCELVELAELAMETAGAVHGGWVPRELVELECQP